MNSIHEGNLKKIDMFCSVFPVLFIKNNYWCFYVYKYFLICLKTHKKTHIQYSRSNENEFYTISKYAIKIFLQGGSEKILKKGINFKMSKIQSMISARCVYYFIVFEKAN